MNHFQVFAMTRPCIEPQPTVYKAISLPVGYAIGLKDSIQGSILLHEFNAKSSITKNSLLDCSLSCQNIEGNIDLYVKNEITR